MRYRTDEEAERERRQIEEYAAHMESSFNLLRTELVGKTRADIEDMFHKTDRDQSGSIDQSELDAFLSDMGVHFTQDEVQKALVEIDADDGDADTHTRSDGEISFDELLNWLLKEELWVDPGFELIRTFYANDTQIEMGFEAGISAAERTFYRRKASEMGLESESRGEGAARTLFLKKLTGPAVEFPGQFTERLLRGADIARDNFDAFDANVLKASIEGDTPQPWLTAYGIPDLQGLIDAISGSTHVDDLKEAITPWAIHNKVRHAVTHHCCEYMISLADSDQSGTLNKDEVRYCSGRLHIIIRNALGLRVVCSSKRY